MPNYHSISVFHLETILFFLTKYEPAEPPATEASATISARIGETEARDIALKHAGLTANQVSRLRVEFDYDDGVPEYEVDFVYDGFEYDYEIHAETGKILSWDKDRDD